MPQTSEQKEKTERKREAGGMSLIRAKGHSIGWIYIVKALRLIYQLFLSMFCLTDSFPHREPTHFGPRTKATAPSAVPSSHFTPNYETCDK